MGVAREIGEDGLGSGERPLSVAHPLGPAQRRDRGGEGALVSERREVAEEGEAGRPRVFVAANRISNAEIAIMPHNLTEQDVPDLIGRLCEAITASAA